MRALVAMAAVGLLCSACVSMGTNFDPKAVERLQVGQSIDSVVATLGRPNAESTGANGETVLVWIHSKGSVVGASARSLRLTFDKERRLVAVPPAPQVLR